METRPEEASRSWVEPILSLEGSLFALLFSCLAELDLSSLYGIKISSNPAFSGARSQAQECFSALDTLRGVGPSEKACYERNVSPILEWTVEKACSEGSSWSIHSQGFKFLGAYILSLEGGLEEEKEGERMPAWRALAVSLSNISEGNKSA